MNFEEKARDLIQRSKAVAKWRKRLSRTGLDDKEFCKKHRIPPAQLSRWLNGKNNPNWESINRVEKALVKEGV